MKTPRYEVIRLENGKFGVVDTRHQITIVPVSGNEYKEPYAVATGMTQERAEEWAATLNECRPPGSGDQEKAKAEATARLIAAAPELLQAAKAVMQARLPQLNFDLANSPDMLALEAAIAKAEGSKNE